MTVVDDLSDAPNNLDASVAPIYPDASSDDGTKISYAAAKQVILEVFCRPEEESGFQAACDEFLSMQDSKFAQKMMRKLDAYNDISLNEKQHNKEASALKEQLAKMEATNENYLKEIVSAHREEVNRLMQESSTLSLKLDSVVRKDAEKQTVLDDLGRTVKEFMEKFKVKEQEVKTLLKNQRKQHNTIMELKGNIRVFCRVRPFLTGEAADGEKLNFTISEDKSIMAHPVDNGRSDTTGQFSFDHIFGPDATQEDVFKEISELVQSALDGYQVCIFAYGQTGCGKTHTMIGGDSDDTMGMIPRSVEKIFKVAAQMKERGWSFKFTASFIEIYNELCRDLLVNQKVIGKDGKEKKLDVKIDPGTKKVSVPGLTTEEVSNKAEILRLLARSNKNRATAETAMSERSSRSHSVFRLGIKSHDWATGATLKGGLNLVDLAGSERLNKSKAEVERLKETRHINKSLSALSNVIASLANNTKHIPYRNSQLTTLLSDSLGGDSKTLMFVNVGPSQSSYQESVSSLRFAATVNQCHIGRAKRNTVIDSR